METAQGPLRHNGDANKAKECTWLKSTNLNMSSSETEHSFISQLSLDQKNKTKNTSYCLGTPTKESSNGNRLREMSPRESAHRDNKSAEGISEAHEALQVIAGR